MRERHVRGHRGAAAWTALALVACAEDPDVGGELPALRPVIEASVAEAPALPTVPAPATRQGAPRLTEVEVVQAGKTVRVEVAWDEVSGARLYEVQLGRKLTFEPTVRRERTEEQRHALAGLRPALYYLRVRAIGPTGPGPFSGVRVVDAKRSGPARVRQANDRAGASGASPTETANAPAAPLVVTWREPEHQTLFKQPRVLVAGSLTRGASLSLNGRPVAADETFALPLTLEHGRNHIVLVATLGAERRELSRDVYYADPRRLGPYRERLEKLRVDLEEIRGLRSELQAAAAALEKRVGDRRAADVTQLEAEVRQLGQTRSELDAEVAKAIAEIDRLLAP